MEFQLKTPIALIVFNRPHTTEKTFSEIANAKPRKLLVVADGPRPDQSGEAEKCAAVRAIIDRVDWNCEVLTNYSDINLGCKRRVSSGLDWVFSTVEEAIILEDDCVPHPSFFRFCQELLEKYRNDSRIMMITGTNYLCRPGQPPYSYFFSRHYAVWGWATWKRAWATYDVTLKAWRNEIGPKELRQVVGSWRVRTHLEYVFDYTYENLVDTWDYQWMFNCLFHNGLAVTPAANLVKNIGITGTHTSEVTPVHYAKRVGLDFELVHPPYVHPDTNYERYIFTKIDRLSSTLLFTRYIRKTSWLRWAYPFLREGYRFTRRLGKVLSKS